MLIVHVKKNDIERALKELKSKVIKTRQNSHLNNRKEFTKKSVSRREEIRKAKYKQLRIDQEGKNG
jgi:small subunit ribosomal protein S21